MTAASPPSPRCLHKPSHSPSPPCCLPPTGSAWCQARRRSARSPTPCTARSTDLCPPALCAPIRSARFTSTRSPHPMPSERADITLIYLRTVTELLERIHAEEYDAIGQAAEAVAAQIRQDRLVHIFGPGGHSNLAAQEVFFRAGGLMHVSAILDEGTLLSNGALRSMAI